MLMPANMLTAYVLLGIGEAVGGQTNTELLFFAVVFAVPLLISIAIFAGISTLIAKLIALLKGPMQRNLLTALLVIGLWSAGRIFTHLWQRRPRPDEVGGHARNRRGVR